MMISDLLQTTKRIPVIGPICQAVWSFIVRISMPLRHRYQRWQRRWRVLSNLMDAYDLPAVTEGEKRDRIIRLSQRHGARVFVETGTYLGVTTAEMANFFDRCITIELSKELFEEAARHLSNLDNVEMHCGDSATILPTIVANLEDPTTFWLDAHYSAGRTAMADVNTPIVTELKCIMAKRPHQHLILIDDARHFVGRNGYPSIAELKRMVEKYGDGYQIRTSLDMIIIYPEII